MKTPLDYTLKLLSMRSYSESSMAEKLIRKGFSTSQVSQTIKKLKELSFINDETYGENMIRHGKLKYRGKARTAYEMHKKGLDRQLIDGLIQRFYSDEEERAIAIKALNKKKVSLMKYMENELAYKKKLYDFLQRKGFSSRIVEDLLNEKLFDI